MAFSVQPSRFSVLRQDDDSDEKNTKTQPESKADQKAAEQKKKANKKKQKQTEEIRNLAFCKVAKKAASQGGSHSTGRAFVPDSQRELWIQKDEESCQHSFEKDLSDALLLSKLEYEEKERAAAATMSDDIGSEAQNGEVKKKKKKKPKSKPNPDFPAEDQGRLLQPARAAGPTVQGRSESCLTDPGCTGNDLATAAESLNPQVDKQKKAAQEKHPVKDFNTALLEKEEELKRLQSTIEETKVQITNERNRNGKLCTMLGKAELSDVTTLKKELKELRESHNVLNKKLTVCTSELEKERSKGHALKGERDKLKVSKQGGK